MRFTIRDLLWLTVVVAMGVGWWFRERALTADTARAVREAARAIRESVEAKSQSTMWEHRATMLRETAESEGWLVHWGDDQDEQSPNASAPAPETPKD